MQSEPQVKASPGGQARFLNKTQLAERYGISIRTVDNLAAGRVLPVIRIGRIVRFDPEACDMAMKQFERKALS